MRTFKELQDSVLNWIAESNDTDKILTLTKDALNQAQRAFLADEQYDFMLSYGHDTINVEAGRKQYHLNPLFGSMLYVYNPTLNDWMEEIPAKGLLEHGENPYNATQSQNKFFMLTSLGPVRRQPSSSSVITVTTTGGTELAANTVIIRGINDTGEYQSETLSSGSPWSTLSTSTSFTTITDVIKTGATWSRTITLTDASANTLVWLASTERSKQYRQFEFIKAPEAAGTVVYRYYMKTKTMDEDYDTCHVPEEFDQILVYRALMEMQGYIRPTPAELEYWTRQLTKLENNCKMAYTQTRSLGGRPSYIQYRERY